MYKFENDIDEYAFLMESSLRSDTLDKKDPDREDKKSRVKDYEKSKLAKKNWRLNRAKMMKGINKFHKSTKGKKFHRKLGRHLAMRDSSSELSSLKESLVSLQSLKTHLSIGIQFNSCINEEVAYELLFEEAIPILLDLEERIIHSIISGTPFSLTEDDKLFLSDLVIPIGGEPNDTGDSNSESDL